MMNVYDLRDVKLLAMDYLMEQASHNFEELSSVTLAVTDFVKYIGEQAEPVPYTLNDREDKNDK